MRAARRGRICKRMTPPAFAPMILLRGIRGSNSATINDISEVDSRIGIVILVVVVQVVDGEVEQTGAKQREGNVELGRSVRERPEEGRSCASYESLRADFG